MNMKKHNFFYKNYHSIFTFISLAFSRMQLLDYFRFLSNNLYEYIPTKKDTDAAFVPYDWKDLILAISPKLKISKNGELWQFQH